MKVRNLRPFARRHSCHLGCLEAGFVAIAIIHLCQPRAWDWLAPPLPWSFHARFKTTHYVDAQVARYAWAQPNLTRFFSWRCWPACVALLAYMSVWAAALWRGRGPRSSIHAQKTAQNLGRIAAPISEPCLRNAKFGWII